MVLPLFALPLAAVAAATPAAATTAAVGTGFATGVGVAAGTGSALTATNVLLGSSVASSVGQGVSARTSTVLQGKALQAQATQRRIGLARERRRIVREAQSVQAGIVAQAESQGVSGSSSAITAGADVGTQLGREQSFLERTVAVGRAGSEFLDRATRARTVSGLFGATRNISNTFLRELERG